MFMFIYNNELYNYFCISESYNGLYLTSTVKSTEMLLNFLKKSFMKPHIVEYLLVLGI